MLAEDACVWAPRWSAKQAVAMVGVKRKLRRARTSEDQDSRAMQYKLSGFVIYIGPLQSEVSRASRGAFMQDAG